MNFSRRIQAFDIEKIISLSAAIGVILVVVFVAFILILYPLTSRADGILSADYPDAALINEGRALFFNETLKNLL